MPRSEPQPQPAAHQHPRGSPNSTRGHCGLFLSLLAPRSQQSGCCNLVVSFLDPHLCNHHSIFPGSPEFCSGLEAPFPATLIPRVSTPSFMVTNSPRAKESHMLNFGFALDSRFLKLTLTLHSPLGCLIGVSCSLELKLNSFFLEDYNTTLVSDRTLM